MSLIVEHVTGGYGHLPVLKDISFSVQPGEMVGLIGLNGAGKSTTIKHIIGLLEQKKGSITINDLSLKKNTENTEKQIGFIPETPSLYEELTLREHIEVTAMAYDIPIDIAMQRSSRNCYIRFVWRSLGMVASQFFKRDETKGDDLVCFLDRAFFVHY